MMPTEDRPEPQRVGDRARRSRGNARAAIALVALTTIAAFVAWRRAPPPATEESASSSLSSIEEGDAIAGEMRSRRASSDDDDAGTGPDAGISTRIVPTGAMRGRHAPLPAVAH
jgi:hypothetical protein